MDKYHIILPQITEMVGVRFIQPIQQWCEPGWIVTLQAEYEYKIIVTPSRERFVIPRLEKIIKQKYRPTTQDASVCLCKECIKTHGKSKKFKAETEVIASYEEIK